MAVTQIRKGTKATPQAVFSVCEKLLKEQGRFRNEDVIALIGGGGATVTRLVKLFRQYQPVIAANDALDAEVTINLVQALDNLLKQQLQRSEEALRHFLDSSAEELSLLSDDNAALEEDNAQLREQLAVLKEKHDALVLLKREQAEQFSQEKTQLQTQLDEEKRQHRLTKENAASTIHKLTLERDAANATITHEKEKHQHAIKSLALDFQGQQVEALRQQAESLEHSHKTATDTIKALHAQQIEQAKAQYASLLVLKEKIMSEQEKTGSLLQQSEIRCESLHTDNQRLTITLEQQKKQVNHLNSQIRATQNAIQEALKTTRDVLTNEQKSELQTQFEQWQTYWAPILNDVQEALISITGQVKSIPSTKDSK